MGAFNLKRFWLLLAALVSSTNRMEAARILAFFPHPLMSHQDVYRPVIRALGERGHRVTYFSGFDWDQEHPNVEHRMLDLGFVRELRHKIFDFSLEEMNADASPMRVLRAPLHEAAMLISRRIVSDPLVRQLIRSDETYDLVMTEAFEGYEHFAVFAHKFNATSVAFLARGGSAWANEMSGLTDDPTYMTDFKSPYGPKMGRLERLHNAVILQASRFHGYRHLVESEAFVDEFLVYAGRETRPPLGRLASDQALVLLNSHRSIGGGPRPRAPHVKEVGGVSVREPKALPAKIRGFVEGAEHGVIYVSLGNHMDFSSPFKETTRDLFLRVFSKRKERVLWKWSGEGLDSKPENVMFVRRLPQPDILAHNRTKLFISHGGLPSLMEAVSFAVPFVGIVMSEDSRKNMRMAKESGYALDIDFRHLTEDSLNGLIDEMINNTKYKEKMSEVSSLFKDRPLRPVDEAVYWIEFVLRHGKALQPASLRLLYHELHMWDLTGIGGLVALSLALLTALVIGILFTGLVVVLERRSPTATLLIRDKDKRS